MENFELDNAIWVAWQSHRRTETLTSKMSIPLYIFSSEYPRFIKHPVLAIRTIWLLFRVRPRIFFVQNPSAFLTVLAILLKPIMGYCLIVDAHNAGVYPCEKDMEKFKRIFPVFHRYADVTIVTNDALAKIVNDNAGRAVVLPDAIPEFPSIDSELPKDDVFVVTFICTYAPDEPYKEVFASTSFLPEGIKIFVTGDSKKFTFGEKMKLSPVVTLTGFLSEREFVRQLSSSHCIMDLTNRSSCLVCGAYEAVALGVPMILSDTKALRSYFRIGAIFTENTAFSIARAIMRAKENHPELKEEVSLLRDELIKSWDCQYGDLLSVIYGLGC